MAIRSNDPQAPIIPPIPPDPRRASREGVGGISSDPHSGRTGLVKALQSKEQGSNPNVRGDGGSGGRSPEAIRPEGTRELPIPPASSSKGENPFAASTNILETIASRFNEARELQKAGAWKQLQTDLMNASPYICPVIIQLKDLINICQDIEKEIKGSSSQVGKSNEEILSDFLSGGSILQIKEDIDKHGRIGERDGESAVPPEQP